MNQKNFRNKSKITRKIYLVSINVTLNCTKITAFYKKNMRYREGS